MRLAVRNRDDKPRSIPPFELIDEDGREYETSSKAWKVEGCITALDSLNPGVRKDGVIVFDVPRTREYDLKVSGGYWSPEDALIELNPE